MSVAITEDHLALARSARDFLGRHDARAANRALLEAPSEALPAFWSDLAQLGWLGLHLPEEHGGSGFCLEELVVVVEQLGRAVAPGPFVPTVVASSVVAAVADEPTQARLLPGLNDGSRTAAVAFGSSVGLRSGGAYGVAGMALGGGLADLLVVPAGEDVLVVDLAGAGVQADSRPNLDPARRSTRVVLDGAPATVLAGAAGRLRDVARLLLSAEAIGVAAACTEMAAEYAKVREQFGRPIATFQAVKHHCANMQVATSLATAAVWDAARAASAGVSEQEGTYAAAVAASLAGPAADLAANLNIQVHGGIGYTWEHDAHLFLRRATVLNALLAPGAAAAHTVDLVRAGVRRSRAVQLPPEAESVRTEVRSFVASLAGLDADAVRAELVRTGYANPHWPRPWGRAAGPVEQLVIEEEFSAAQVTRPAYGITGWVILTLIQHGTPEQVERWVPSALSQDVVWCQLFSEPAAGSDAAGVRTRASKVDGGWCINGQKVWTSGAHRAGKGFITVRTDPTVPKHQGITTMVVDMSAPGVQVRPLRMTNGTAEFNEVYFDDVFVPDDDVVGPVDGGWTVARATLGNESVSIGGNNTFSLPVEVVLDALDAPSDRLTGGAARVGRYLAQVQATTLLNLRSAQRAVAGGGPGAEGNITKLVLSETGHEAAAIMAELAGADTAFLDGPGIVASSLALSHRGLSIAGGTSEIKRNQIAERILGLPRDPLVR
jgi:alkylation response protein AidB-like acyl-CoA dehydrogenase